MKRNPIAAAEVESQFDEALSLFDFIRSDLEDFQLGDGPEKFREYIDFILNPSPSESIPVNISTAPVSGTTQPGPQLQSGITGAQVNPQIVAASQQPTQMAGLNFGQRFLNNPSTVDRIKSLKIGNTNIV